MICLRLGDCLVRLDEMDPSSVHVVASDPPYDLTAVSRGGSPRKAGTGPFGRHTLDTKNPPGSGGFMGQAWDGTGIAFSQEFWGRLFRVLKPGGTVKVFGGTRTFHRMAAAMEQAGFLLGKGESLEAWGYGSGFPKSLSVEKSMDRRPGALPHYGAIKQFLADAISESPKTRIQIDTECGFAACDFTRQKGSSPFVNVIPDEKKWMTMKAVVGFGDDWDDAVRSEDRPVVGKGASGKTAIWQAEGGMGAFDITEAASVPAQAWKPWGTALKPAWEPVLVGRKP